MGPQLSSIYGLARKLPALLLLGGTVLSVDSSVSLAQTQNPFAFRVEAPEVIVPVVVIDRTHYRRLAETAWEELDEEITDLSPRDFRIFEDGVKQQVQNVDVEQPRYWDVRDNVSHHIEHSSTPRGIWAGPDFLLQGAGSVLSPTLQMYLVSYVPPPSPDGSCHRIQVKVARPHATVYARAEYCNTKHPPSDPLYGTRLGKQMESYAESAQSGEFPISAQVSSLLGKSGANRVDIALEFPWEALKRKWRGVTLDATIAVLGMVFDSTGVLAARFSDIATTSPWNFYRGPLPPDPHFLKDWEFAGIPNRYEIQIDLPAGDYQLKVVVTDGAKFAQVEIPLNVEASHRNSLAVSGIVLCKRVHEVPVGGQAAARAPQYVPLIGNGLEFTPAGDTRFKRSERMLSYFEIQEPESGATGKTTVQFQMRVTDANTGEIKSVTSLRPAESAMRPENHVIPVAAEIAIDNLTSGNYRLEVQALDSASKDVVSRATPFTIE